MVPVTVPMRPGYVYRETPRRTRTAAGAERVACEQWRRCDCRPFHLRCQRPLQLFRFVRLHGLVRRVRLRLRVWGLRGSREHELRRPHARAPSRARAPRTRHESRIVRRRARARHGRMQRIDRLIRCLGAGIVVIQRRAAKVLREALDDEGVREVLCKLATWLNVERMARVERAVEHIRGVRALGE